MLKNLILALSIATVPLAAQNQNREIFIKGQPNAAPSGIPAALADVKLAPGAGGTLRCSHAGGRPCSDAEVKALTAAVNNSRSNIKNNIAAPGTLTCTDAAGKACSDSEIQAITKQWDLKTNRPSPGDSAPTGQAPAPKAQPKK